MPGSERILQREIMVRLRHAPLAAVVVPSPNGIFIPTRDPKERTLARRIMHQLKVDGQILAGAPDLLILWRGGSGGIELKRPAAQTLFGKQRQGVLSDDQRVFRSQCEQLGIPYAVCTSWPEVRDTLKTWGRLPADWRDPEQRIGRAA